MTTNGEVATDLEMEPVVNDPDVTQVLFDINLQVKKVINLL